MTQRSERWLIVGACLVLYALAMGAFVLVTDQPMRWVVGWLLANVGYAGTAVAIVGPIVALLAWTTWRDRHLPPVEFTPPKWPRWAIILRNLYLAAIAFCMVAGMGTFIAVSLMR